MPLLTGAAATAATAAATGGSAIAGGAFKYNRLNYMFDMGLRFSRYVAGYSMACEQTAQYREDVRDLTNLLVVKCDRYHFVGIIMIAISFHLIMAGRLGVHGPAPATWLMAIYWPNVTLGMMFELIFMWLANHASARASAGAAHLLTRNVRLPIPSSSQLDKARAYGNQFEKARFGDMLRVPFVTSAPKEDPADLYFDDATAPKARRRKGKNGEYVPTQGDRPTWCTDELKEQWGAGTGEAVAADANAEHFELYRGLMHEWWSHDVYARVAMFLGICHWMTGLALYIQCHTFCELRAMWPAWTGTLLVAVAHWGLIRTDILPLHTGKGPGYPIEWALPLIPIICVIGMTLDYSVLTPTTDLRRFILFLSWPCYIIEILWAFRMLEICAPCRVPERPDTDPGHPWWPEEWWLPTCFQHALYVVSPPKQLEKGRPGTQCLLLEMKAMMGGKQSQSEAAAATSRARDARDKVAPALYPWKIVRGGIFVAIATWTFTIGARIAEHLNDGGKGRKFLKESGRVTRPPGHMQPFAVPWTREGSRNAWGHTGGADRRLEVEDWEAQRRHALAQVAEQLIPVLGSVADVLDHAGMPSSESFYSQADTANKSPERVAVTWPQSFHDLPAFSTDSSKLRRAHAFACSDGGAIATIMQGSNGAYLPAVNGGTLAASPFRLIGVDHFGDVLGLSLGTTGLLITSTRGSIAECSGAPVSGVWQCKQVEAKLPLGGSSLDSAVVAHDESSGTLRAAIVFKGDSSVTLFQITAGSGSIWVPTGEVQLPIVSSKSARPSLSFTKKDLLIATEGGRVVSWPLESGEPAQMAIPVPANMVADLTRHASCSLGTDRLGHLFMPHSAQETHLPELYISDVKRPLM